MIRITRFDSIKAEDHMKELDAKIAEVKHHLAHLTDYAIEYFKNLKKKYGDNYPSFISLITGPSRTGDIERVLVLGAHGPKKLTIVCL